MQSKLTTFVQLQREAVSVGLHHFYIIQAAGPLRADSHVVEALPVDGDGALVVVLVRGFRDDSLPRRFRHLQFHGGNLPEREQRLQVSLAFFCRHRLAPASRRRQQSYYCQNNLLHYILKSFVFHI